MTAFEDRFVAGVHSDAGSPADVAAAWRKAGWRVGVLDGPSTRADALAGIGTALDFPAWYGRNLDALWDCLTDLTHPTVVVWGGWPRFAVHQPRDWAAVLDVLTLRTRERPPFAVVFAGVGSPPGGSG